MKSINDATILVVDDTEANVDILLEALGQDYDVSVAINGELALESVAVEIPDLILLDVMMPDIDGYEVCSRLKSHTETANIPIIFLTTLTDIKDKTKGFEQGAVDYITKPFEVLEVKARVRTHLSIYLMAREIEEQRKIAQENAEKAEQATRAKAEFLATMSHEIRTPMNGVLGMVQLLFETELTSQQMEYAKTIYSSGEALLTIINDILDLSKLEAGKLTLEAIPYDPRKIIQAVSNLMLNRAEEKGLTLITNIAENIPEVLLGDGNRIRQVLLNFISNAIKFTSAGKVELEIQVLNNGRILFSVSDSGIGIDDAGKKRLFKDFSQVDSSISREFGGTGLGLSICSKIIQLMNGEIGVESELNKGSTFWFSIPMIVSDKSALDIAEVSTMTKLHLPPLKILLAEDNLVNQQVALGFLKVDNHDVCVVKNGLEAFEACAKNNFDVVLMDMQMPEMDGITSTRKIRESGGDWSQVPIIALTANAMSSDIERCFEAGMNGFVTKPVKAPVLMREIARVAGVSALEEQIPISKIMELIFFDSTLLASLESTMGQGAVVKLISKYTADIYPEISKLRDHFLQSKIRELEFSAHKIKGASANLAMQKLAESAGRIEELARGNNLAGIEPLVEAINTLFDSTIREAERIYDESFALIGQDEIPALSEKLKIQIISSLNEMNSAICAEDIHAYEVKSDALLVMELPDFIMSKLGLIDKQVFDEQYSEASQTLETLVNKIDS